MAEPFDDDLIAAKSVLALVGGAAILGGLFLFNAEAHSALGIVKGIIGISLCVAAIIGGRAFTKGCKLLDHKRPDADVKSPIMIASLADIGLFAHASVDPM